MSNQNYTENRERVANKAEAPAKASASPGATAAMVPDAGSAKALPGKTQGRDRSAGIKRGSFDLRDKGL